MKLFKYNWSNFNVTLGLQFMIASVVFFNVLGVLDFPVYPAGFAALLAWITIILAPGQSRKQYLSGLMVFVLVAVLLTLLTSLLIKFDSNLLWIISLGVVSFIGFLTLKRGVHYFMIAWCSVYWYMLAPLFFDSEDLSQLLIALLSGSGLVFVMNCLPVVWSAVRRKSTEPGNPQDKVQSEENSVIPSSRFIRRYALVVSICLMSGVAAGIKWLSTDPTVVANSSLNVISPSFQQTWVAAIERAILGVAGIILGFYLGWYSSNPIVAQVVIVVCSFFAVGSLFVNGGMVVGIFFFLIAYSWGGMQNEQAHLFANEKIVGELVGVVLAVLAIYSLKLWNGRKRSQSLQ